MLQSYVTITVTLLAKNNRYQQVQTVLNFFVFQN